jgi:predicted PurR-regulated permease PerM
LALFGVSYSVILGAFVGAMTLVPAVGFIISLIPVIVVALATGHSLLNTVAIVAALVGCNMIDNYYLTPKFVGNRLNINALTSFVGLFAGGLLWGIWGMFLSIPMLGVLRIAFSAVPKLRPWGELLADKTDHRPPKLLAHQKETGRAA